MSPKLAKVKGRDGRVHLLGSGTTALCGAAVTRATPPKSPRCPTCYSLGRIKRVIAKLDALVEKHGRSAFEAAFEGRAVRPPTRRSLKPKPR
jgi:hypothetical protein